MPNPQTPTPRNPRDKNSGVSKTPRGDLNAQGQDARRDVAKQGQSSQDQTQSQDRDEERDESNGVEIGDPVPENDRTIRATGTGQGETGEDEDLPDDDGSIEGTRSERH